MNSSPGRGPNPSRVLVRREETETTRLPYHTSADQVRQVVDRIYMRTLPPILLVLYQTFAAIA